MKQSIRNSINEYLSDLRLQNYLNELDKFPHGMKNVNAYQIANYFYILGSVFLMLTTTRIQKKADLGQATNVGRICFEHRINDVYKALRNIKMPSLLREVTEYYLEIGQKTEKSIFDELGHHPSRCALNDYLLQCIELFDFLADEIINIGKRYQSH